MADPEVWQVVTTTDTAEEADKLAAGLVENRFAACVQIDGPIKSTYRWEGRTESDPEWRLTVKTTADRYPRLEEWLLENHSYDVPELLATAVIAGNRDYIAWAALEVSESREA